MPGVNTMSKGASGFDPRSIPGCVVWLDAADPNTFTPLNPTNGASISQWRDKSGNNNHGSQATGSQQPTYISASNSLNFTRTSSQVLNLPNGAFPTGNSSYAYFIVCSIASLTDGLGIIGGGNYGTNGQVMALRSFSTDGRIHQYWFNNDLSSAAGAYSANTRLIVEATYTSGGTRATLTNGTQLVSDTPGTRAQTNTNNTVGASYVANNEYLNGTISEVIVFSNALTTAQRQAVEGYLAWKWRLEISSRLIPTSIPNCILWLDGNDPTTITRSGTNVTGWTDKSGLANNTTSVSATNPTYSATSNGIVFSSPNTTFLRGNFSQTYQSNASVFVVTTLTSNASANAFPRLLELGTATTTMIGQLNVAGRTTTATPYIGTYFGGTGPTNNNPTGIDVNIFTLVNVSFNSRVLYTNVSTYDTGTTTFTNLTLSNGNSQQWSVISSPGNEGSFYTRNYSNYGLGNYNRGTANTGDSYNGIIHEVLIFSRILTTTERQTIEGYLGSKWGLTTVPTSVLPLTHPFSSNLPLMRRWTPNDLGTLPEYWFDAADLTQITATGTTLTTLANKGSAGSNGNISVTLGTAITGTTRINGNNLIVLSNGARLTFTSQFPNQTRSRYVATRPTQSGNVQFLFQGRASSGGNDFIGIDTGPVLAEVAQGQIVTMLTGTIASQVNNFAIYTFVNAATTANNRIAITGASQTLSGANNVAQQYNTASIINDINGAGAQDVGEILSYNSELTLAQTQLLEGYLAWKWGVNRNLPTTHPYYFAPPTVPNVQTLGISLTNSGAQDSFIAKYDTNGLVLWAARIGGIGQDNASSIAADTNGNSYVVGTSLSNPVSIFNQDGSLFGTLSTTTSAILFLVKYDTSGRVLWAARMTANNGDLANSVSVDSAGNVYVTGYYAANPISFFDQGGTTASRTLTGGSNRVFVVKYDTNGTVQWAAQMVAASSNNALAYGISSDSAGNTHITGSYSSASLSILNQGGGTAVTLANLGEADVFVAKYNTSGTVQWGARIGGTSTEQGNAIAVDSTGSVYVVGGDVRSTTLNIYTQGGASPATSLTFGTTGQIFLAKYNSAGTTQWAAKLEASSGGNQAWGAATDSANNIYLCGSFNGATLSIFNTGSSTANLTVPNSPNGNTQMYIVKYNSSGTVQWATALGGNSVEEGYSITTDTNQNVYLIGRFVGNSPVFNSDRTLFTTIINSSGTNATFIIKYNSSGFVQWVSRTTGKSSDVGYGISSDTAGNIYVAGAYLSNPLFMNSTGV